MVGLRMLYPTIRVQIPASRPIITDATLRGAQLLLAFPTIFQRSKPETTDKIDKIYPNRLIESYVVATQRKLAFVINQQHHSIQPTMPAKHIPVEVLN
jgi:hypothetical protein